VPPDSVLYIGHIEANMRPWAHGDFLAGPRLPTIPQTALGVTDSSFDVVVQDRTQADLKLFGSDVTVLTGVPVKVSLMSPFDQADAYKPWLTLAP
jgi:hypothetical protein